MTISTNTSYKTPVSKRLFTVKEYYKMAETGILHPDERVELLNGEIITMSPINSPHAGVVSHLYELLFVQLQGKTTINCQNPIHLADTSEPEPDITVAHFKKDRYRSHHPKPEDIYFIIEVADSTLEKDRKAKRLLYAKAGIGEYWIVNVTERQIEVFSQPADGNYQIMQVVRLGEQLSSLTTDFVLNVDELLGDF